MTSSLSVVFVCASLLAKAIGLDDTSFVQKSVSVHTQLPGHFGAFDPSVEGVATERTAGDASSCACVDWSRAYQTLGVKCGSGRELDLALSDRKTGPEAAADMTGWGWEYCWNYYYQLHGTQCQKVMPDMGDFSWCYVQPQCYKAFPNQDGGPLKTKSCSREEDSFLGDNMTFEDMMAYSDKYKLEKTMLVRHAFPVFKDAEVKKVMGFWVKETSDQSVEGTHDEMSLELKKELEKIKASGKPTVFTSDGLLPYAVAEGDKFYWLNTAGMWFLINYSSQGKDWENREKMNKWGCVAGCEQVVKPWYKEDEAW